MRDKPEPSPPPYLHRVAAVSRTTARILRLEGAVAGAVAAIAYSYTGEPWWLFALLFFVPDVSMLGYLASPKLGAITYNVAHSYTAPACLAGIGLIASMPHLAALSLIWVAHIGFDRALGYGLKGRSFADTHLGRLDAAQGLGI